MPRREYLRMERFAAEAIKAQRDAAIKAALKAKVPYTDLMAEFDIGLAEIMAIVEKAEGLERRGSSLITKPGDPRK